MSRFPGLEATILRTLGEEGCARPPLELLAREYFWQAAAALQARGLVVTDQVAGCVRPAQVPCPVCAGEGQLSHQEPGACLCCKGDGSISRRRDELLAGIRRDIAARLAGGAR